MASNLVVEENPATETLSDRTGRLGGASASEERTDRASNSNGGDGGLFENCLSTKGSASAAAEALNNTFSSSVENKLSVMALDDPFG